MGERQPVIAFSWREKERQLKIMLGHILLNYDFVLKWYTISGLATSGSQPTISRLLKQQSRSEGGKTAAEGRYSLIESK